MGKPQSNILQRFEEVIHENEKIEQQIIDFTGKIFDQLHTLLFKVQNLTFKKEYEDDNMILELSEGIIKISIDAYDEMGWNFYTPEDQLVILKNLPDFLSELIKMIEEKNKEMSTKLEKIKSAFI